MNITGMDLWDVLRLIKSGETTSSEVVGQCLEKARETAYYNAFTFVNKDKALEGAAAVDEKIKADRHTGILAGYTCRSQGQYLYEGYAYELRLEYAQGQDFRHRRDGSRKA